VSLVQGGSVNIPFQSISGNVIAPTTPIIANTSIPNALVATGVRLLADYVMIADGGALARPAVCFAGLSIPNPALPLPNGMLLQLSLCEAQALIAMGAARYS